MAVVVRVLPWRRSAPAPAEELAPIIAAWRKRAPKASVATIQRAYEVAAEAHRNQFRQSGEAYINHPLSVAKIVADLGCDETTIAAALLHDAVEDSELTVAEVRASFGDEIAAIVDGVTKLERIQFDSKEAQQSATMRKMLVAMAKDLRVLIIKLADRLHNMRTIGGTTPEKQQRIAAETQDIYAPLAHRLGMDELRQQLEDLSFASLHPRRFAELDNLVAERTPGREAYLAGVVATMRSKLADMKLDAEVSGRTKHLYSIYDKMMSKGREFEDIFDVMAIRVIVPTQHDCYAAMGMIHMVWPPISGRFKDYIASPKFNSYQSLHTTVTGPDGRFIEVQVRTPEMHLRAEKGVASHSSYKDREQSELDWLKRIIDWQADVEADQFMDVLRTDLAGDELEVLTPKGGVVRLPAGSTPIDFAYAVHSAIGHSAIGARVNGRLVGLGQELAAGDICEIITSKVAPAGPREEWLEFVVTPKARNKIRQFVARGRREGGTVAGRELLIEEFERLGLRAEDALDSEYLSAEVVSRHYPDRDTLFRAIAEGHVLARPIAHQIAAAMSAADDEDAAEPKPVEQTTRVRVELEVRALDRPALLRDISDVLSECMVNIVTSSTAVEAAAATMRFSFDVSDANHAEHLVRRIFNVSGVTMVSRLR